MRLKVTTMTDMTRTLAASRAKSPWSGGFADLATEAAGRRGSGL